MTSHITLVGGELDGHRVKRPHAYSDGELFGVSSLSLGQVAGYRYRSGALDVAAIPVHTYRMCVVNTPRGRVFFGIHPDTREGDEIATLLQQYAVHADGHRKWGPGIR